MIFIGADHRGFNLKARLIERLKADGYQVKDLGNFHLDPSDDYVDFALKVAENVKNVSTNKGILLCGSGVGVEMVANKIDGIRAALVQDEQRAAQSRLHEDANVISLPADILDEYKAYEIIKVFLNTQFSGESRHIRRLEKVKKVEKLKNQITIVPAILATNQKDFEEKIQKINKSIFPKNGWVQIDLMDNKFVKNKSIPTELLKNYHLEYNLEGQLMVEYPEVWIEDLVTVPVERIVFPLEVGGDILGRVKHIKNHSIEAGISINPQTPVEKIRQFVSTIDLVLVMSVEPGFGKQKFIENTINKVKQLDRVRQEGGYGFKIEVDGGVNDENALQLINAGADCLVMGSYLMEGDFNENFQEITNKIQP